MIYVKSILAGFAGALVATILWILAVFVMPLLLPVLLSRLTGSGGVGSASITSGSILAAALIGFVAGSYWQFRRLSKCRA
jgi:hypothetical protein